ncbi:uncharacterized protein PFL1_01939 [Pseudozyma flocculosa PF-1]|uniref:Thiaminase-2/PQQC domain-containing protein n=1 Tax=Pseudozyma flocculosa TaxID=84751 RepID=A0A5C3EZ46_9BASI|nr:uncharacterized protein PFL1_01939 [Pseudozyma flocculosa PF-1]EPQ30413.1 hypothetical protein PFL1_01939 [Pseudozyma flocculosa PF-1]SPO37488.1 uncharacterized protein PSFLO_02963 [Pseudozyma flocculosa]
MSASPTSSLTAHLLSLDEAGVKQATQHPFLWSAGSLTISNDALSAWLTQDRLYAMCGYTRLMGNMIARMHVPEQDPDSAACREWKQTFTTLSGALSNIHREINFFETTAARYGLSVSRRPSSSSESLDLLNPITRGYIDYMASLSSHGSHAECAVLLWAMEELYLRAWTYARTHLPSPSTAEQEAGQIQPNPGAADEAGSESVELSLRTFIHNWTSDEFQAFVRDCKAIVERLPQHEREGDNLARLEKVWRTVLWYEQRFWDAK